MGENILEPVFRRGCDSFACLLPPKRSHKTSGMEICGARHVSCQCTKVLGRHQTTILQAISKLYSDDYHTLQVRVHTYRDIKQICLPSLPYSFAWDKIFSPFLSVLLAMEVLTIFVLFNTDDCCIRLVHTWVISDSPCVEQMFFPALRLHGPRCAWVNRRLEYPWASKTAEVVESYHAAQLLSLCKTSKTSDN